MSPTFRALGIFNYRLYFIAAIVTNTGAWMQRVAQDWLVLEDLDGGGVAVGITTGLQFLPFLLITPYAGVLADRYSKRMLLAITQTVMGLSSLVLGVLVVTGVAQLWHVYVLAFVSGIGAAVDNPARQAFVNEMVGRDALPNAVALNSTTFHGARMLGPALAGFLILAFGTGPVFIINFVTFGAVILALARMRVHELEPSPRAERGPGLMREGLRYVRSRPDLQAILVAIFFVGTFGLNFQMTSVLMATEVFDQDAAGYGILGSIMAVGSLAGALLAARREVVRMRLVVVSGMVFGLLEVVVGLMPNYLTFAIMLVPLGLAALTFMTAANTLTQLSVSPHLRGRVMALYMTVFIGGTPFGAPVVGWIGETFGARWTLVGGGLLSLLGVAVAALLLVRKTGMVVRTTFRPWPRLEIAHARSPTGPSRRSRRCETARGSGQRVVAPPPAVRRWPGGSHLRCVSARQTAVLTCRHTPKMAKGGSPPDRVRTVRPSATPGRSPADDDRRRPQVAQLARPGRSPSVPRDGAAPQDGAIEPGHGP